MSLINGLRFFLRSIIVSLNSLKKEQNGRNKKSILKNLHIKTPKVETLINRSFYNYYKFHLNYPSFHENSQNSFNLNVYVPY